MSAIQETFADGASIIHRLDPRGRLVIAALFAMLVAAVRSLPAALGGLVVALGWLALARLPVKKVLVKLLLVNGFIFFLWLVLPWTYPGETIWKVGPLAASRQGVEVTALITLKSNAIIIGLMALVTTVPVTTLGQAMQALKFPDKLCHLLLFTYRYIYVFEVELQRLVQAMKIRGFQPRTNLHTYRSYAYLAGMLLVRSYDRAQSVFQAMLCRGFHGVFYSLKTFSWQRRDGIFMGISSLLLLALLFLAWRGPVVG